MINKMNSILNSVEYIAKTLNRSLELIEDGISKQLNTEEIDNNTKSLIQKFSKRNVKDSYILNVDSENDVYLNFIPSKLAITDFELKKIKNIGFDYFTELSYDSAEPISFDVLDGTILRAAAAGDIKNHQYYLKDNGILKPIPNFKTVQVMLAERGKIMEDVKIVESYQLAEILVSNNASGGNDNNDGADADKGGDGAGGGGGGGSMPIPDKTSQWTPEMDVLTFSQVYEELAETAESAQAIIESTLKQVQSNLDVMQSEIEQHTAEAHAAKAEAEAAKAVAQAAILEAEIEKATLEAEKVAFEQQRNIIV